MDSIPFTSHIGGSHIGGSRSGPIHGIQLPEHEPLEMDLTIQMPGDDPIALDPRTPRVSVESNNLNHISDPDMRRYKAEAVDSDSCIVYRADNSASNSNTEATSLTTTGPSTASPNSNEVLATSSGGSSAEQAKEPSGAPPPPPNDEEQGLGDKDVEKTTEEASTDRPQSFTLALEGTATRRWFLIGIIALFLVTGVALTGIICGSGGCSGGSDDGPDAIGSEPDPTLTTAPTTENVPSAETDSPITEITPTAGTLPEYPELEPTNPPTYTAEPTKLQTTLEPTMSATTRGPSQTPTFNPSNVPTTGPTDIPTTSNPTIATNTTSPTETPTNGPTIATASGPTSIVPDLPESTLQAMADISTPQGQALLWVRNYPNFEALEDWRKRQLFSMATYYRSLNGHTWPLTRRFQWLDTSVNECDWASLQARPCNFEGEMESLGLLNDYDLQGSVPPEVGLLTELEEFRIVDCGLEGTAETVLPHFMLESLSNLKVLHLENNALTGTIPTTIAKLTSLQYLHLQDTPWMGELSSEIGLLSNLRQLDLSNTDLTGSIPVEWGALTNLEVLHLSQSPITGSIPSEVCNLPLLTTVTADCDRIVCCT